MSTAEELTALEAVRPQIDAIEERLEGTELHPVVVEHLAHTIIGFNGDQPRLDDLAYNAGWWHKGAMRAVEKGEDPAQLDFFYDAPKEVFLPFDGTPFEANVELGKGMVLNYDSAMGMMSQELTARGFEDQHKNGSVMFIVKHAGYMSAGKIAHGVDLALLRYPHVTEDPRETTHVMAGPAVMVTASKGGTPLGESLRGLANVLETTPPTENSKIPGLGRKQMAVAAAAGRNVRRHMRTPGNVVIMNPTGTNDINGNPGPALLPEGLMASLTLATPTSENMTLYAVSVHGEDDDPILGLAISDPVRLEAGDTEETALQKTVELYENMYDGDLDALAAHRYQAERFRHGLGLAA